jgi:hypothetical protein
MRVVKHLHVPRIDQRGQFLVGKAVALAAFCQLGLQILAPALDVARQLVVRLGRQGLQALFACFLGLCVGLLGFLHLRRVLLLQGAIGTVQLQEFRGVRICQLAPVQRIEALDLAFQGLGFCGYVERGAVKLLLLLQRFQRLVGLALFRNVLRLSRVVRLSKQRVLEFLGHLVGGALVLNFLAVVLRLILLGGLRLDLCGFLGRTVLGGFWPGFVVSGRRFRLGFAVLLCQNRPKAVLDTHCGVQTIIPLPFSEYPGPVAPEFLSECARVCRFPWWFSRVSRNYLPPEYA